MEQLERQRADLIRRLNQLEAGSTNLLFSEEQRQAAAQYMQRGISELNKHILRREAERAATQPRHSSVLDFNFLKVHPFVASPSGSAHFDLHQAAKAAPMTTRHNRRVAVLTDVDIQSIAQGATRLPGNWHLDPVTDLSRRGKPRVWIRKHWPNADEVRAISLERLGRAIWVSIVDSRSGQSGMSEGWPFDTMAAALVYIGTRLEAKQIDMVASDGLVWRFAPVLHGRNLVTSISMPLIRGDP
jgi:hypothetical protein